MALAERMLAARFNTADFSPIDHHTYVICSDGDLMEGLSHEAFSVAGHLALNKLIVFYDFNKITIEGSTDLAYSDDVKKRFLSYHWNVIDIDAHNYDEIEKAIRKARREKNRPTLIISHSHIAQGSPNMHDTAAAHGAPLGDDEIRATKKNIGLPEDEQFYVPAQVRDLFDARLRSLKRRAAKWQREFKRYSEACPDKNDNWSAYFNNTIPADLDSIVPEFDPAKPVATRSASSKVLQSIASAIPSLVGGAADLAPSTKTLIENEQSVAAGMFGGRNLHFGVREHAMCSIQNGMILHGGLRVYTSTFFVFADYCRPALRLAALMQLPAIYVFTHDSFYVGEDGPTHQPVEHVASLRCMPNMTVIRPADPTETAAAWVAALKNQAGPTALILTRQNLAVLDRTTFPPAASLEQGAYTLCQSGEGVPDIILIASGSEVEIALKAAAKLADQHNIRVVSMPSWELFEKQDQAYKDQVLPPLCAFRLAIEAGSSFGWEKYIGQQGRALCVDRFGASAPCETLAEKLGFTPENVINIINEMI